MKMVVRILVVLVVLFAAFFALQMYASERGEVVVLTTQDETGQPKTTRIWVVDYQDHAWLRAGSASSGWAKRLIATPIIKVQRGNQTLQFTAVPTPDAVVPINALFAAKYGWSDDLVGMMVDHSKSLPIRLDPRAAP